MARKGRSGPLGYVEKDAGDKSNIFAVEPKSVWTTSPRSEREAGKGLGGVQGIGLALGLIGLVGLSTVFVAGNSGDLEATGESLGAIASRISATL